MTHFAAETFRMPRCIHSFDDSSNDEFSTFATARCIQDVETMFAIFSGFKFVEQTIGEWTETLGTTELKMYLKIIFWILSKTYQKHSGCHNSPLELTILALGSKPTSHRVQHMLSILTILKFKKSHKIRFCLSVRAFPLTDLYETLHA